MKNYFYIIEIKDPIVRCLVNAMRVLADPNTSDESHITLRGPQKRAIDLKRLNSRAPNIQVSVIGAGNFFKDTQNTVFFRCGFPLMDEVWFKPDFPGRNAHTIIYDSENYDLAYQMFHIINKYNIYFNFHATEIKEYVDYYNQLDLF